MRLRDFVSNVNMFISSHSLGFEVLRTMTAVQLYLNFSCLAADSSIFTNRVEVHGALEDLSLFEFMESY